MQALQIRKLEKSKLRLRGETRAFRPEIPENYEPETELKRANARNFGTFSCKSPPKSEDWVADDPVDVEPVSGANSLLTGKLTGNFVISAYSDDYGAQIAAAIQWLRAKIPYAR